MFNFGFDPNDPKKMGLMMAAAALMANKGGNVGQALGQAIPQGLMAYQGVQQNQMRSAEEEQQRKMRELQMGQMQRQAQGEQAISDVYSRNTMPGNLAPNDDMGNPMPAAPQGLNMDGLRQGLMSVGPAGLREAAAIQSLLQKQQPKYHNVGGNLVPEPTMPGQKVEPVYQAPKPMPDWQNPDYQKFMLEKAKAGSSRVTVDTRQENEFNKKMGANYAEEYTGILKAGAQSGTELQELQRFESIITKVPTGKLEPLKAEVAKLGASLGFDVDTKKLGFQESLEALSNKFALTLRNPAGGAGMPGALSDKDRIFLVSMVPGLAKTPAGNRIIVEAFKRAAQRKAEAAQLARDYVKRKGTFDAGYYQELEKLAAQDIMSDLREQAEQLGGGADPSDPLGIRAR